MISGRMGIYNTFWPDVQDPYQQRLICYCHRAKDLPKSMAEKSGMDAHMYVK